MTQTTRGGAAKAPSPAKTPAKTLDGCHSSLMANIELPEDLDQALENGRRRGASEPSSFFSTATGCPPRTSNSRIRAISSGMKGHPGRSALRPRRDKHKEGIEGLSRVAPNPALGLRAVRFCLAEPRLFLTPACAPSCARRIRPGENPATHALIRGRDRAGLVLIGQAKEACGAARRSSSGVEIGGMIEIPPRCFRGAFATRLDFLSSAPTT